MTVAIGSLAPAAAGQRPTGMRGMFARGVERPLREIRRRRAAVVRLLRRQHLRPEREAGGGRRHRHRVRRRLRPRARLPPRARPAARSRYLPRCARRPRRPEARRPDAGSTRGARGPPTSSSPTATRRWRRGCSAGPAPPGPVELAVRRLLIGAARPSLAARPARPAGARARARRRAPSRRSSGSPSGRALAARWSRSEWREITGAREARAERGPNRPGAAMSPAPLRAQRRDRYPQPPRAAAALPRGADEPDPGPGRLRGDRRRRRLRRRQRGDGRGAGDALPAARPARSRAAGKASGAERRDRGGRGQAPASSSTTT